MFTDKKELLRWFDFLIKKLKNNNAIGTLRQETEFTEDYVKNLATAVYDIEDLSALLSYNIHNPFSHIR